MYRAHFGLREMPFGITPDTSFAYACTPHQEALNTLLVAVRNGEGFIKIVGEVGTGKTLLCRRFLATLDASHVSAYIPNPYLEPRTLLFALAEEPEPRPAHLRAPGKDGRAVPRRGAGDADRDPRSAAPAHQPRDRKAEAPAGRAVRPARARREARAGVGAPAASADHVSVPPCRPRPGRRGTLPRPPPARSGLSWEPPVYPACGARRARARARRAAPRQRHRAQGDVACLRRGFAADPAAARAQRRPRHSRRAAPAVVVVRLRDGARVDREHWLG